MVSIDWCKRQKNGLERKEPNINIANSYIRMAEESINALKQVEKQSQLWTATMSYYIFYYSLYALMQRIGIKCEIHSCSLQFMKEFLQAYYNEKDSEMITKAFTARIDLQYYADRSVDKKTIEQIKGYCKEFFIKTKDILARISEGEIRRIQEEYEKEMRKDKGKY